MKRVIPILILFACLIPIQVGAQEEGEGVRTAPIRVSGEKGSDYIKWTEAEKSWFVAGLYMGIGSAPLYVETRKCPIHRWLMDSFNSRVDATQIEAIITKYINDHPEEWHKPLTILIANSISKAFNPDWKNKK